MISALELNITGRTNFMSIFTRPRPLIRGSFVGLACAVAIAGTQLGASAAEEISAPLSTVSDALVAVEAAQPSETPAEAEDPVVLETPSGTLEFETPGEGDGHEQADGLTTVFAGEDDASYVAVQPVETGVRALVVLEDASAPREFDFPVTGDVADLRVEADGSVLALDAEGNPLATAAAPWAVDAVHGDHSATGRVAAARTDARHHRQRAIDDVPHDGTARRLPRPLVIARRLHRERRCLLPDPGCRWLGVALPQRVDQAVAGQGGAALRALARTPQQVLTPIG